jgi:hypothetical protein
MNSNKIFAGTNAGVYSSSDGTSWTYKALDTHAINTLCFIGTTLYAGTDGGVYNSPDQGLTWGETGQGTSAFPVYSLCAVNGEIYAGTSFGILHYTDSLGVHYWYPANGGIINSSVISMVSYQNILFASTGDQHVYMTKTGGDTWGDITDNLTDSVMTIIIHNYNLYAATNGSGLWSRSLGDFTGINNRDENSTVSVFPNPARNKITIRLNGPSSHAFQVEISNLCGQVVFSGSYPVQSQETSVELDCSQLSLGLYTVRVITGTTSIAKKLIKQ